MRKVENQLSMERTRHLEAQCTSTNALAERDKHVERLLESISELHGALERAQKMALLVGSVDDGLLVMLMKFLNPHQDRTSHTDKAHNSVLEVSLREEISTLRKRLNETQQEVEAQQKVNNSNIPRVLLVLLL